MHCSHYSSRRLLSLYIFTAPVHVPLAHFSGKTKFMSRCISLRQTDGYTQSIRHTYTARQSYCSFYATLFMLYFFMLDSDSFSFSCPLLRRLIVSPLLSRYFTYFLFFVIYSFLQYVSISHQFFLIYFGVSPPKPPLSAYMLLIIIISCPSMDFKLSSITLTVGKKAVKFPTG